MKKKNLSSRSGASDNAGPMPRAIPDPDNSPLTAAQLAKMRPVGAKTLTIVRKGRRRPPSED
jgi:hypothetical protein